MKPVKDGGPAFPTSVSADSLGGLNHGLPGMSLRDYFAAAAMQGICAAFRDVPADAVGAAPGISEDAYRIADAMLAEREVRPAPRQSSPDLRHAAAILADYIEAWQRGDDSVPERLRDLTDHDIAAAVNGVRVALATERERAQ